MGNGGLGGDTGGFWAEVRLVTVTNYESIRMYVARLRDTNRNEFTDTRNSNEHEMRNMRNVFLVNSYKEKIRENRIYPCHPCSILLNFKVCGLIIKNPNHHNKSVFHQV